MTTVHIYGAGSIGNHLAFACRSKDWNVTIADPDPAALERTRKKIYPSRYGQWDESITLTSPEEVEGVADLVIIGTPPDLHMKIAASVLQGKAPRVMLIEKPLCTPDLSGYEDVVRLAQKSGTHMLTGYNHVRTRNTLEAERLLASGFLGKPVSMTVRWLEHWGGIFGAHPWLSGPSDSYLGFSTRGGGACGEHSHGINLFQHFARYLGAGGITDVACMMDCVDEEGARYDRLCMLNVRTAGGLTGSITQDVVTSPAVKTLRIQGESGFLEWYASYDAKHDAVIWGGSGKPVERTLIPRSRPDDFIGEIDEVDAVLAGKSDGVSLSLARGFETMQVIAAAHKSNQSGRLCHLTPA